jgi:hypothetical protein
MLNASEPTGDVTAIQVPLYEAVIGERNAPYYLAYFRRADARGYAPVSWHWPALWIAVPWLLYRRQYLWAFICFGFPQIAAVAGVLLERALPGTGTYLFFALVFGFQLGFIPLYANAIYYRWARHMIGLARDEHPGQPEGQVAFLRSRGGTSLLAPAVAAAVLVLAGGMIGPGA